MNAIWIAIVLALPTICIGQKPRNDLDRESLRGNVKTIYYSYRSSPYVEDLRTVPPNLNDYCVDSFSIPGEKLKTYWIKNGVIGQICKLEHGAKGNIIDERCFDNQSGETTEHTTFTYGKDGNVRQKLIYGPKGMFVRCVTFQYASGRLSFEDDSTTHDVETTFYYYNSKGEVIEKDIYSCLNPKTIINYSYDNNGNVVSEAQIQPSPRYRTFKYDQHGNRVMIGSLYEDGTETPGVPTEYSYDHNSNWVRRIETLPSTDPIINTVTVRTINYY